MAALNDATIALKEWLREVSVATSGPTTGGKKGAKQKLMPRPVRALFLPLTQTVKDPKDLIGTVRKLDLGASDRSHRRQAPVSWGLLF